MSNPSAPTPETTLHAAARSLHLPLGPAASQRLLNHLALLQRWNRVYNLTAVRDPDAMLSQHLVDCLAVVPPLQRWIAAAPAGLPRRLLDVGSGGGLPGVVLAVLLPDWQVDCVDTVAKKAGFLRQVAAELGLPNLHAHHARVEQMVLSAATDGAAHASGYGLITSRAFASLHDFTQLSRHLLAPGAAWVAMKGKPPNDELAALAADVSVFHVEQLQVPGLDAQRCLVWMRPT